MSSSLGSMKYLFKGRLSAILCDDSRDPLSQAEVRLYRTQEDEPTGFVSSPQAFTKLDDGEAAAKAGRLFAVCETDAEGYFYAEMPPGYQGKAFEVDVVLTGAAGPGGQLHVALVEPLWKRSADHFLAGWAQSLPRHVWCRALGVCHGHTLCGRVVDCHTRQVLSGVKVSAFGLDWNQDQALGSAVTDAKGRFVIQSPNTVFSRIRKVSGKAEGAYDLYFRIQSSVARIPLYVESLRWGARLEKEAAERCLTVDILVETDLARLHEEGRVAPFMALTGSKSILGLRSNKPA